MGFRNLTSTDRGAVRTITINRPDKLNALNRETINELDIAFSQAGANDAVRVVVLAGAGEKAFVAGADISELNTATPVQAQGMAQNGQRMMPQPRRDFGREMHRSPLSFSTALISSVCRKSALD